MLNGLLPSAVESLIRNQASSSDREEHVTISVLLTGTGPVSREAGHSVNAAAPKSGYDGS